LTLQNTFIEFKASDQATEILERDAIEHMRQRCEEMEKSIPEQILKLDSSSEA